MKKTNKELPDIVEGRLPTPIKYDSNSPLNELYVELIKAESEDDLTRRLQELSDRHKKHNLLMTIN